MRFPESRIRARWNRSSASPQASTSSATIAAETVPGYGSELWVGLFAVRGTPPEIVARLHREITNILDDPKERAALTAMGVNPATSTPEELAALLKQDLKLWQGIVAKVGVKID